MPDKSFSLNKKDIPSMKYRQGITISEIYCDKKTPTLSINKHVKQK